MKLNQIGLSIIHNGRLKRYLLFMKLTAFLILGISLQLSASVWAQNTKMSVNLKNSTLQELFIQIERNSNYRFFYNNDEVDISQRISIDAEGKTVENILTEAFEGLPYGFKEMDKNLILVERKEVSGVLVGNREDQQMNLSGTVTTASGEPIPGVSILIKGTNTGTITDFDGKFSLNSIASDAVLVFSFVGMQTQEVIIAGQTQLSVVMKESAIGLDEVVAIGYGTMKKRDITGSISSVKKEDITAIPTSNVLETMQGKVAGLDMTNSSGALGSPLNFTVRGNRSLTASNAPLILVDGIAYGADLTINPNDVESIEVLKDASTTAIYGSRGANGVILITTKKGTTGEAKVDFNAYFGPTLLTNLPKPNNTEEYVAFRREAMRAVGQWSSPADDATIWDAVELQRIAEGVNTDWLDLILDNAFTQDYQVSVSGGTKGTKVAASLNYKNETGVLQGEELNRYNGRINISQEVGKGVEVGASAFFNYNVQNAVASSVFHLAQTQAPYGVPFNEDGTVNKYPFTGSGSTSINILMNQNKDNFFDETKYNRFFGTAYIDAELTKGLVYHSNFGFDSNDSRNGRFEGVNSTYYTNNNGLAKVHKRESHSYGLTWENTLSFNKDIDLHSFGILIGQSMSKNSSEETYAEGSGLSFEQSWFHNLDGTAQDFNISSQLTESSILSFFTRLNYKFNDRYLVTATMRADGSSVLAKGNQWGYFPSVALAWRMKSESFMENVESVSDMKLRVSYGLSGNSAVSPYQTAGGLSRTIYSFGTTGAFGYRPFDLANEDLKWEITRVANLGLDLGLFNNRLYAIIDTYKTWTSDLLLPMILPGHTGFTEVISNVGKTETQGLDLSINSVNVEHSDFKWTSDLTFSTTKEKITALNSKQDDVANGWFIGSPTRVFYDYEKVGIWQTSESPEAESYGQAPGDIKVKDQDDSGAIDANEDRKVLGQQTPKWTAGLTNRFEYKGWEFSFFVYARIGQLIRSDAALNFYPSGWANSSVSEYWTPENPSNSYPRPNFNKDQNMLYYSTLGYRKGDFVKIKDITLGYNFPKMVTNRLKLSQLRVYSTLKNFFTFSKFDDYDPERGGAVSYPMTKQVVFGLNVSF